MNHQKLSDQIENVIKKFSQRRNSLYSKLLQRIKKSKLNDETLLCTIEKCLDHNLITQDEFNYLIQNLKL